MFFWKDKEKNKPTIIEHPVLGTLIKKTDWYTKKSFIITLWDKTFDLYLCIYSNQKDAVISFEQEKAIRYYFDNQIQIERDIKKMLLNFFHTSDCSLIEKSIQIEGLNFTRNGAISIGLIADFSDEFLEKHIGEDVIFTDSFGMSVYPIKAHLGIGVDDVLFGVFLPVRLRQCFQMRKYITTSIINTKEIRICMAFLAHISMKCYNNIWDSGDV